MYEKESSKSKGYIFALFFVSFMAYAIIAGIHLSKAMNANRINEIFNTRGDLSTKAIFSG